MARRSSRLVQLEEEQEKAESARKEDKKHNNSDRKKKNKRKKQEDSEDDDDSDDDDDDDDEETVESNANNLIGSLPGGRRTWEESFAALVKFKKKTGHCIVPSACTSPFAIYTYRLAVAVIPFFQSEEILAGLLAFCLFVFLTLHILTLFEINHRR